jgi:hypothetical protein
MPWWRGRSNDYELHRHPVAVAFPPAPDRFDVPLTHPRPRGGVEAIPSQRDWSAGEGCAAGLAGVGIVERPFETERLDLDKASGGAGFCQRITDTKAKELIIRPSVHSLQLSQRNRPREQGLNQDCLSSPFQKFAHVFSSCELEVLGLGMA